MLKKEVEREALALALVVIILTSLFGTWAIMHTIDEKQEPQVIDNYQEGAKISLVILPIQTSPLSENTSHEGVLD
ncbi:MAG TPA: hypothetical protein VJH37_02425 [Candidatus Nanoarchaeia archaeon]|nr:hypothetical protein [Candidatus Nanoarchaeia archaeon]